MDVVTADEFTEHFDRYREAAEQSPLTVTDVGRTDLVVLGADEYRRLKMLARPVPKVVDEMPANLAAAFERSLEETRDVEPEPLQMTGAVND